MKEDLLVLIKNKPISVVISQYISLKKIGQNQLKGLCPFHKEKTPSFNVDDSKNFYKCFGCGEGGDAISFVQKMLNLNFQDSLQRVCEIFGIYFEKNTYSKKDTENIQNSYSVNEEICNYYHKYLQKNKDAFSYLQKRGISPEVIDKFKIGFAPSRNEFTEFVRQKGIDLDILKELSLIKYYDNKFFPFFENRIMIPIIDRRNKIVGFGGRIISENKDIPKYINSSNSSIFKKSENLYNINNIYNKKIDELFVLEGYMDVISMYSNGFNAIASLGTAINEKQISDILKINNSPIFCFDNDSAGLNATIGLIERAFKILEPGHRIKILRIERAKDVDEYIRKHGRDSFLEMVKSNTLEVQDFIFDFCVKKYDIKNPNEMAIIKDYLLNKTCNMIQNQIIRESYKNFFNEKIYLLKYQKNKTNNMVKLKNLTKDIIIEKYIEKLTKICKEIEVSNYENLIDLAFKLRKKFPDNSFSLLVKNQENTKHNIVRATPISEFDNIIKPLYDVLNFYIDNSHDTYVVRRIMRKNLLDKKKSD